MEAAKYILEGIAPSRRGRLVEIEGFPEIRTPADVPAALASLANAMGSGTITMEEATAAGNLLHTSLDTYETARRLLFFIAQERVDRWVCWFQDTVKNFSRNSGGPENSQGRENDKPGDFHMISALSARSGSAAAETAPHGQAGASIEPNHVRP
jgi:hypothetical protein